MSAILEIPEVRQRVSHLTVDEYHRFSEQNEDARRTELVRGIVIDKMSKPPLHGTVLSALVEILGKKLSRGFVFRQDQPLTFADSEPEPDIAIVRGTRAQFSRLHPSTASLVIEIAVSSVALDRANTTLYAEAAVSEYWIILAAARQVEVYREPLNGNYKTKALFGMEDVIECMDVPGVIVPVAEIFADLQ